MGLISLFGRGTGGLKPGWSAVAANVKRWSLEKRWSALAFGFPLFVFCLSRSKLPLYVLPLFGPLSVFIAAGLQLALERDTARLWKWATVLALTSWLLAVVAKGALPHFPGARDMKALYTSVEKQVKDFDPARLAVFGKKTLNGLQFYAQRELPHIDEAGEIQELLKSRGASELYVVVRPAQTNKFLKLSSPARVAFTRLGPKWMLARVSAAPKE